MKKNLFVKLLSVVAVALLTFSSIAGCANGSTSSSGGGATKVLWIITDTDDTFRKALSDSIVSQASALGVSLDMVETAGSIDTELELISTAKSKGYSAIICRPADNATALQLNVTAEDIPIIYVNNQPSDDHLTADKFIYVGSDEQQAGQYQAEYVVSKLGKGSMNVIIFEGEKGHSATINRTLAVKKTLKANGVNANYVFVDYANWTDTEAEKEFDIFMKTGQSVDAIFCNNDTMALGAIQGLKNYGLDYSKILVCGVDATADGCASIAAGEMSFTVLQNAEGQAAKAVEAAKVLGSGGTLDNIEGATKDHKYIWVDFEPVDKSNVSKYMK
ncbi:substrate-binding domain-containing protein [Butyrivibrio sp. VCD2006]|uniref:substrate-binding domain-containing protein n=1 Tax=Butyrivibrio sp. VCD2006 TaxID=1280664 RepID=UPI00047E149A|nr:substrate-binding domain-containing protein [Butyrivibrio sp. VCD2006]